MSSAMEIQLIAIIISIACSIMGTFLILQKKAMLTDAITHTILLGIVLAFFIVKDLNSPYLIIGATITGVITVWLTQIISDTELLSEDASIGIVFPFLFSIAIILISMYAPSSHLDTDAVFLGELAFVVFNRMTLFGFDIGAKAIYTGGAILLLNILFIIILFKELKLVTFDKLLAVSLGISPVIINYLLMSMISLTAVGSFEIVGSVLVIAFMIGPANTAYLLTDDLKIMLILSSIFGGISAILGYQLASIFDVSIAGSIAVTIGILFAIVFIFAPEKGLISIRKRKLKQKNDFQELLILFSISKNTNINSNIKFNNNIISKLKQSGKITEDKKDKNIFYITPTGLEFINNNNLFNI